MHESKLLDYKNEYKENKNCMIKMSFSHIYQIQISVQMY